MTNIIVNVITIFRNARFILCRQFLHFQTAFVFKFVAVCVLFVTALSLPASTLHGVWRQWGWTLASSAAVRPQQQFRRTYFNLAFNCYLQLSIFY